MEYGIKDVTVPLRLKFSSSLFPAKTHWTIIEIFKCEAKHWFNTKHTFELLTTV